VTPERRGNLQAEKESGLYWEFHREGITASRILPRETRGMVALEKGIGNQEAQRTAENKKG